jgi:hypothetical protein
LRVREKVGEGWRGLEREMQKGLQRIGESIDSHAMQVHVGRCM